MSVNEPSSGPFAPSGRACSECGAPLVAELPGGVCAACALRGALALTEVVSEVVVAEQAGDQVGRYKLLEKIGEGGCGVVYLAEQTEPLRRRVALKVVKLGMDTKQVIARFEAERQALAMMDHPHIAKVLDAGATDTGRPYFVMELVRGIKITDYCDQNQLATKARLELFMQVCQAVQHAHQKGIIHRDLKPSNILVTRHDGVPVPKVIDFGIAKATAQQALTDKTLFTAFQQFLGTPAYMSPEQAELSGLDIDTRSDIYSLGVLLYELLTGKIPFEAKDLLAAGLDEMRRVIREQEPPKPSTRLSSLTVADLTSAAKRRDVASPKLINLVRGDLDWIVMKCLEKDRTRRYDTPNDLARDLDRHLRNEPVLAAAPSTIYKLGRFVRRHWVGLATASVFILLLIGGVVVNTWQTMRAIRAEHEQSRLRQDADAQRQRVEEALKEVATQRNQAQTSLADAERQRTAKDSALADSQQQRTRALEALAEAQMQRDLARSATLTAEAARDESLRQQAEVEDLIGFMLFDLSEKLRPIGQADLLRDVTLKISAHYQALTNQDDSEATLSRRYAVSRNLGYALAVQGDIVSAERQYRASLEIAEKLSSSDAAGANWLMEHSVGHERIGEIKLAQGNLTGALDEFTNSLTISEKLAAAAPFNLVWQERLLIGHLKVAEVLRAQGDQSGAVMNYQAALKLAQAAVVTDPKKPDNRNNLALVHRKTVSFLLREGDERAAMLTASNSLWLTRELVTENPAKNEWQSALAESLDCMGDVWLAEKKADEALIQYRQALEIRRQLANAFPANAQWQQDLLRSQFKVVDVLANEGRHSKVGGTIHDYFALWRGFFNRGFDIAEGFFQRDLRGAEAVNDCSNLVGRVERAVANYPGNQEWQQDLARIKSLYGDLLLGQQLPADALAQYEKAFAIRKQMADRDPYAVGAQYWLVLTHINQAAALSRLQRQAEAFQQARQALLILGGQVSRWPANAVLLEGPQLGRQRLGMRIPLAADQLSDANQAFTVGSHKAAALAAKETANLQSQAEWGDSCFAQAVACWFDGHIVRAITCSETALKIWEPLAAAVPTNGYYAERRRQTRVSLAVFQLMHRQFSDSIQTADRGLETNSNWVELKAIRTLACFCALQEAEGWQALRQNQGLSVGLNQTFPQSVMADLRRLRKMGVTQVNVEQLEQHLALEGIKPAR